MVIHVYELIIIIYLFFIHASTLAHGMKLFWKTCSLSVASTDVCVCAFGFCSSKGSTLSRRSVKKAEISGKGEENGRGSDSQVPTDDLERNQKILQWMMEGEALRHKKNRCCDAPYTSHTLVPWYSPTCMRAL